MNRIFGIEGPVWSFLGKLTDIIILSLLFVLTSLPIITIGASLSALYAMMFRLSSDTEGRIVKGYFKEFAAAFPRVTPLFLLQLLIALFLTADILITMFTEMPGGRFLMPVAMILAVVYLFFMHYFFPLFAKCDVTLKQVLLFSLMMPFKEILRTLFMVFITGVMIAAGIFVCGPFLLLAPGVIAFSHVILFRDIFKKYDMQEAEIHA